MDVLDYIRIVGLTDIEVVSSGIFDVTFNIVYSQDSDFRSPKRGVFALRLSDFIDITVVPEREIENIALRLIGQILIREKSDDGSINVLHLFGIGLGDWLVENARCNKRRGGSRT